MAGVDYISVSSNQTFPSGSTNNATRCINISISEDQAFEGDHTFTVILTTDDTSIMLGTTVTVITIIDDDGWLKLCIE